MAQVALWYTSPTLSMDDSFNMITTRVKTEAHGKSFFGSGFFYTARNPIDDFETLGILVATNRHVLLPIIGDKEVIPEKICIYFRRVLGKRVEWVEVELDEDEINSRTKYHPDRDVDVALVDVDSYYRAFLREAYIMIPPRSLVFGEYTKERHESIEIADDILAIGYPEDFYDDENLCPVVKSGIIASRWGVHFQGRPCFLIDCKLFPGSSGSIVVSKPSNFVSWHGRPKIERQKEYVILGIFSANYTGVDLGEVWYAQVIEETRTNGVSLVEAICTDRVIG